jgi:hypothetical protein
LSGRRGRRGSSGIAGGLGDVELGDVPADAAALLATERFDTDAEAQAAAARWHGVTWHKGHQRFRVVLRQEAGAAHSPRTLGQHLLLRKAVEAVARTLKVSVAKVLKVSPVAEGEELLPLMAADRTAAAASTATAVGSLGSSRIIGGTKSKYSVELAQFRALLGIYPSGWMPRDLADMVQRRQRANLSQLLAFTGCCSTL